MCINGMNLYFHDIFHGAFFEAKKKSSYPTGQEDLLKG